MARRFWMKSSSFAALGIVIEEIITKITGLKNEDLIKHPSFLDQRQKVRDFFSKADASIAHDLPFDKLMLTCDLARGKLGLEEVNFPSLDTCTVEESAPLFGHRMRLQASMSTTAALCSEAPGHGRRSAAPRSMQAHGSISGVSSNGGRIMSFPQLRVRSGYSYGAAHGRFPEIIERAKKSNRPLSPSSMMGHGATSAGSRLPPRQNFLADSA